MEFIPLNFIRRILNGGVDYTRTRNTFSSSITTIDGKPSWEKTDSANLFELYMTTPQLYAVINRRGYLLSSGIWKHYKADSKGNPVLIENSPVVKVLENPNPLINGNNLVRQWNENICVFGNNFEYLNRPLKNLEPATLSNLPTNQIKVKTSGKWYKQSKKSDIIEGFKMIADGQEIDTFDNSEINLTSWLPGVGSVLSDSPLKPLYMPISNIRAAYGFRNVIMTKRGALGILSNQSKDSGGTIPLNPTERERIEKEYQKTYGISDDQLQVLMTNSSLTWQSMSYPTKDLLLFEEVEADFKTIIDHFGLNDNLFSREKASTFTNVAEGMKMAYQSTIIPEAEELAMNRSRIFNLLEKGEWLELCYDHIPVLQENEKEKAEILKLKADSLTQLMNGGFTKDEIRQIINFEPDNY